MTIIFAIVLNSSESGSAIDSVNSLFVMRKVKEMAVTSKGIKKCYNTVGFREELESHMLNKLSDIFCGVCLTRWRWNS